VPLTRDERSAFKSDEVASRVKGASNAEVWERGLSRSTRKRAGRVLPQVGSVERDHPVEIRSESVGQLLEARPLAAKVRAERGRGRTLRIFAAERANVDIVAGGLVAVAMGRVGGQGLGVAVALHDHALPRAVMGFAGRPMMPPPPATGPVGSPKWSRACRRDD
jgi:hypothetical protein